MMSSLQLSLSLPILHIRLSLTCQFSISIITTFTIELRLTRGHFRSRDKDGAHTVQSAKSQNRMLHSNFMALRFIEPELFPMEDLHCVNRDLRAFCFYGRDLDPMTFIYEHDPCSLDIYRMCKYELPIVKAFESYRLTDRQTDRQRPTRSKFAGGQSKIIPLVSFCTTVVYITIAVYYLYFFILLLLSGDYTSGYSGCMSSDLVFQNKIQATKR